MNTKTIKIYKPSFLQGQTQIQVQLSQIQISQEQTSIKPKKMAIERVWAREIVSRAWIGSDYTDFISKDYPRLEKLAGSYIEGRENTQIVMRNKNTKEILYIPYTTRFSEKYRIKNEKKFRLLANDIKGAGLPSLYVVLTIDPTNFTSLISMYKEASKRLNSILTELRREFKIYALKTIETQQNGMIHYNLFLIGVKFIPKDWFLKRWTRMSSSGYSVELRSGVNRDGTTSDVVIQYMIKYIAKALNYNTDIPNKDMVILWSLGARSYSITRDLQDVIKSSLGIVRLNNSNKEWEYIGIKNSFFDFEIYETGYEGS